MYSAGATIELCGENPITTTKLLSFRLQQTEAVKEVHKYLYIFHLTCKSLREISEVETSLEDCVTLSNPLINCVNDIHLFLLFFTNFRVRTNNWNVQTKYELRRVWFFLPLDGNAHKHLASLSKAAADLQSRSFGFWRQLDDIKQF